MCGCLSQDTTGMIDAGVLPCGHTKWVSPNELSDSRKPWAVLYMDANHRLMPGNTDYFWTRWGAKRRAASLGPSPLWRAKVVSNR